MRSKIRKKRSTWLIVVLFVLLGSVSLLVFQFVFAEEKPTKSRCEGPEIAMFRTQYALIPTTDVEARQNVQGKIEAWETMIAICETVTPPTLIPLDQIQHTPWTPPPIETGIFEGQPGAFFRGFEAKIENHWRGVVDGQDVIVFAGAWVNNPDQGFIAVHGNVRSKRPLMGNYPSPTKSGTLRIVDVKGSRLVIQQADSDELLYFDVPALRYVSSLDAIVPTITPKETLVPYKATIKPFPYPYPGP